MNTKTISASDRLGADDRPHIRSATKKDILQLLQLAATYRRQGISDLASPLLTTSAFTAEELSAITIAKEIAVLDDGRNIQGYFLIDNCSNNNTTLYYKECISLLKQKGILPDVSIAARAQIVIHKQYRGAHYAKSMVDFLCELLKDKYEYFFSMIAKDNPKLLSQQKAGWQIVGQDKKYFFVVKDTKYYNSTYLQ